MVRKNFKQGILAFVKPLLFKSYKVVYRAIEVVLSPCCELSGTAVVECDDEDLYTVTITTDPSIGFLGKGTAIANIADSYVTGTITEPFTITFESVDVTAGTHDVAITLLLPTNSDENLGAYKQLSVVDVTFPAC